jgi:hypothetical protein
MKHSGPRNPSLLPKKSRAAASCRPTLLLHQFLANAGSSPAMPCTAPTIDEVSRVGSPNTGHGTFDPHSGAEKCAFLFAHLCTHRLSHCPESN